MDLPYSQQQQARRKNRSAGNLQHLSLAPLTTRLPLRDDDDILAANTAPPASYYPHHHHTYVQGRSAPTTPRLLSKSPPVSHAASRSQSHEGRRGGGVRASHNKTRSGGAGGSGANSGKLPKSRSTTHLLHNKNNHHGHGSLHHRRRRTGADDLPRSADNDDDWLFRAGVLVSSEARESKGQSWLAARASSTSLTGLRDSQEAEGEAAFAHELARERARLERLAGGSSSVYAGGSGSRRGSLDQQQQQQYHSDLAGFHHLRGAGGSSNSRPGSVLGSRAGSRLGSRANSRAHSRVSSRVQLFTPLEQQQQHNGGGGGGYFDTYAGMAEEEDDGEYDHVKNGDYSYGDSNGDDVGSGSMTPGAAGPDFVNLDEKLEAVQLHQRDTSQEDEDHVRRLVRREKASGVMGSWLGSVFGWSLFDVQENDDEEDEEDYEDDEEVEGEEEEYDDDDDDEAHGIDEERAGGPDDDGQQGSRSRRRRRRGPASRSRGEGAGRFEGVAVRAEDRVPPPPKADEGTWQDAAWLLSVASKVIL